MAWCMSTSISAYAGLIEDNAVVAVMDFGTHPGAASSDVALANAEGTTSEYIITKLINDGKHSISLEVIQKTPNLTLLETSSFVR